jgi:hypothetical protein
MATEIFTNMSSLLAQLVFPDEMLNKLSKYSGETITVFYILQRMGELVVVPPMMYHSVCSVCFILLLIF